MWRREVGTLTLPYPFYISYPHFDNMKLLGFFATALFTSIWARLTSETQIQEFLLGQDVMIWMLFEQMGAI